MSLFLFDKPLSWVLNESKITEYENPDYDKYIELIRKYDSKIHHIIPEDGKPEDKITDFVIQQLFNYYTLHENNLNLPIEVEMDFILRGEILEQISNKNYFKQEKKPLVLEYAKDPYTNRILLFKTRGKNFETLKKAYEEASSCLETINGEEVYVTTNV